MAHLMGVRDGAALRHAADLGIAMQLTNICRDVVGGRARAIASTCRRSSWEAT